MNKCHWQLFVFLEQVHSFRKNQKKYCPFSLENVFETSNNSPYCRWFNNTCTVISVKVKSLNLPHCILLVLPYCNYKVYFFSLIWRKTTCVIWLREFNARARKSAPNAWTHVGPSDFALIFARLHYIWCHWKHEGKT